MLIIVVYMSGNYKKPFQPCGNCMNPLISPLIRLISPKSSIYPIYGDLYIVESCVNAQNDQKEHVLGYICDKMPPSA